MIENIGFMQGRLSPQINNRIQSFPINHWEKELQIASENDLYLMEWTLALRQMKWLVFFLLQVQEKLLFFKLQAYWIVSFLVIFILMAL